MIPAQRLDRPEAPSGVVVRGDDRAYAWFSPDDRFRYLLARSWNELRPPLAACMLNPSTADERIVDPTVRKLLHYAQRDGYGGLIVTNLYALRATNPAVLKEDLIGGGLDIVGPHNDEILRQLHRLPTVLAAWGTPKWKFVNERIAHVRVLFPSHPAPVWQCLGMSKDGHPLHPCYLANDTKIVPWSPPS